MAGPGWGKFFVGPLQFSICYGAVIACTLLGGQSLKVRVIFLTVRSKKENQEMVFKDCLKLFFQISISRTQKLAG